MPNGVLRSQNQKVFGAKRHIFQSLDHQSGSLVHVKWLLQKEKHIHSIFASKFLITKVTIMEFKKGGAIDFCLVGRGGLQIFRFPKGGATDFSIFRSTFP